MLTTMPSTLLIELLAGLLAAGLIGFFVGWMIKRAIAKRRHAVVESDWNEKYKKLELRSHQDSENLEDQLQSIGTEVKTLSGTNRELSDALRNNEVAIHKARTDAIELNHQQADTQERLQRIIKQKEEEIINLRDQSAQSARMTDAAAKVGISAAIATHANNVRGQRQQAPQFVDDKIDARLGDLSAKREAWELEKRNLIDSLEESQATIALDQSDLPTELFDQTVRLDPSSMPSERPPALDFETKNTAIDDAACDTDTAKSDDGSIDLNEATIALDDAALSFAKSAFSKKANKLGANLSAPGGKPSTDANEE